MQQVKYISTSTRYKRPFGAIMQGSEIFFRFEVASEKNPIGVRLILRCDADNSTTQFNLSYEQDGEGMLSYSCSVTINESGLCFYRFEIDVAEGILFVGLKDGEAQIGDWLPEWQISIYDRDFKTPDWPKGGIMYQIFPDRFNRSQKYSLPETKNQRFIRDDWDGSLDSNEYRSRDFFCGNLAGITEKLDYLKALNINILYLNPIFESPENHRYSTADYYKIDPYLGKNEDFEHLAAECKKRDIRIVLDGVFSHTGDDSVYFNKYRNYDSVGAYNSPESPFFNWYNFKEFPNKYECWWNFPNLPNVNETHPSFLNFITTPEAGVLNFWQSKGCGGWRLDVADELPDLFLDTLRKSVKQFDNDALIIGEVWEDASNKHSYGHRRRFLEGRQLDSVMNYPWRTAIIDFVLTGNSSSFKERIMSILENYPAAAADCLMNILSTHDTIRIINALGADDQTPRQDKHELTAQEYEKGKEKLKAAIFLQFTLPGIPCIYYGDEVGLSGFKDPQNRRCYPYGHEDFEILDFYKKITQVRAENKERFKGLFDFLCASGGAAVYSRGGFTCCINMGEEPYILSGQGEIVFGNFIAARDDCFIFPPGAFGIVTK